MAVDVTKGGIQFADPKRTLSRRVVVEIDPNRFKLTAVADLPVEMVGFWEAARSSFNAGWFLRSVFGLCLDPGTNAQLIYDGCSSLDAPISMPLGTSISFELTQPIPSEPLKVRYLPRTNLAQSFLTMPGDSFRIKHSPGAPFRSFGESSRDDDSVVWEPVTNDGPRGRRLPISSELLAVGKEKSPELAQAAPVRVPPTEQEESRARTARMIDRIRALESKIPEKLRSLIQILLTAIPFLWFLWILDRYPPPSRAHTSTLHAIVLTFLTLHLTILALALFEASFTRPILTFLADLVPGTVLVRVARVLTSAEYIYPFLAIGMALLVRPFFRAFRSAALKRKEPDRHRDAEGKPAPDRRASLLRALGWLLFWVAVFAIPVATVWARMRLDGQPDVVKQMSVLACLLGGGLFVLWFVLFWLLRFMFRIRVRVRAATQASWAMLLVPLLPPILDSINGMCRHLIATQAQFYPFMLPQRASPYVWTSIVAVLGAILLLHIGELSLRLTQHVGAWKWFRSHNRLLLLLPLLVASIPVISEVRGGASDHEASMYTFTGFFYLMDWLLPYALLGGAVVLVRLLNRDDRFELTSGEHQLGALLFAWYVSGHGSSLLFIPVPFLLAWYMFRRWLIVPSYQPVSLSPSVLSRLLAERRARTRLEGLQKGLDKKLSQGELTLSEYKARLKEAQAEATNAAAVLVAETKGIPPHIFSKGPEDSPWRNGRVAVLYGFLISVPFQLMTLVDMVQETSFDFPILEFGYKLLFSIAAWVLMAAVFGYFYHLVRGRNGFEKALWFSLATVLPAIPLRLVAGESLVARAQLLDIVQVVAFLLVLALVAFDLRTLQKHRYGWHELLTLYGLASAAYGSTILIAIGSSLGGKELLTKVVEWLAGRTNQ